MKQRFTSIDVRAMVRSIRPRLLGAKVANIYDINNKLYILKFTSATASQDTDETTENKWFLVLEAGVRFNLTEYDRGSSAGLPSAWTMKLRKLLRGKRLGDLRQIGSDRVILMEFGAGEKAVIIALEMYAKGNIVVMDSSYTVTMLLRRYAYSEEDKVEVGLPYPMALAAKKGEEGVEVEKGDIEGIGEEVLVKALDGKSNVKGISSAVLRLVSFASPQMATLAVRSVTQEGEEQQRPEEVLRRAIKWCYEALAEVSSVKEVKGYGLKEGEQGRVVDYAPLTRLLKGGPSDGDAAVVEYPSFTECVDDYYTRLMRAQLEGQLVQKQSQMRSKVENIKADQSRRMGQLEKEQQSLWEQAVALEANTDIADAAIQMVNALLAAKLRWDDLAIAVKQQQRAGHPLATHIRQLSLDSNRISIVLEKPAGDDDDDDDHGDNSTTVEVWLDLSRTAQANVALLHEQRKGMQEKVRKTEGQMAKAVKMAEKKLKGKAAGNETAALGGAEKQLLAKRRKKFWFQKFFWFISSDRLLVLAGRDAQQNELLWRRYLSPTDIYVHADLAGAATVVIKMPKGGIEPPQRTLAEAGQYSLCRSRAWDNKIVTSAWWVWAKQVSKTAPTGEFLSTGSFMIRGKKNFLPPTGRLEMGLGVMWTVTEDSAEKYRSKRVQREKLLEQQEQREGRVGPAEEMDDEGPGVVENFDFDPKAADGGEKGGKKGNGQQHAKGAAMSRQQRRQMKKSGGQKQGGDEESPEEGERVDKAPQEKSKPLTRHQRKKLAKIKEKYGDQDEEEREIRMKLMGSKEVKVVEEEKERQRQQEAAEVSQEEEDEPSSVEVPTTGKNVCFKCGEEGHLASECPHAREAQTSRQDDDDEDDDDDEGGAKVTSGGGIAHTLDRLQAWPDWREDEVLGAIMVCAPYQAMTQIPIKVKFTPGQMKRGKAAQLGFKLLQSQVEGELRTARAAAAAAKASEGEDADPSAATIDRHALDLLRLVPIEEASDAIGVSNVKLAASGVQRLQQKSKKEKKQLAKQREKEALLAMDG